MTTSLFENFYDEVQWETQKPAGKIGGGGYNSPVTLSCREVKGSNVTEQTDDKSSVKHNKKYHVPKDKIVTNGDRLDKRLVIDVRPSRGIFGTLHFWIVEVM